MNKKLSETLDALFADRQKESADIKEVLTALVAFAKETRKISEDAAASMETSLGETKLKYKDIAADLRADIQTRFDAAIKSLQKYVEGMDSRNKTSMTEMYEKVNELRDGLDGKDADAEAIVTKVLSLIPKQDDSATAASLESIRKDVEELKNRPQARAGGGTSAMGVAQTFKYIAHTEAPMGDIDGINTVYEVKNAIFWVAGFTVNGEQVAELPNFTYSGRRITFATAIPSAYSGKDIEVKYIGI